MSYFRETSISFFWVCGYNKLNKFKDGNWVFAHAVLSIDTACIIQILQFLCQAPIHYYSSSGTPQNGQFATRGCVHILYISFISKNIIPSVRNGCVRLNASCHWWQRHPGGGCLRSLHQYHMPHCIWPSHRSFTVSSGSVGLLFQPDTLALWPNETTCQNGFIGYALASG